MITPTYKIGDIVRTRGKDAGLTGIVTEYTAPVQNQLAHGNLTIEVRAADLNWQWVKLGEELYIAIYHPSSPHYATYGGGEEPEVIETASNS